MHYALAFKLPGFVASTKILSTKTVQFGISHSRWFLVFSMNGKLKLKLKRPVVLVFGF